MLGHDRAKIAAHAAAAAAVVAAIAAAAEVAAAAVVTAAVAVAVVEAAVETATKPSNSSKIESIWRERFGGSLFFLRFRLADCLPMSNYCAAKRLPFVVKRFFNLRTFLRKGLHCRRVRANIPGIV